MYKFKEYKHNNQKIIFDDDENKILLISYDVVIAKVKNNKIERIKKYIKFSQTTSKHYNQMINYLKKENFIDNNYEYIEI